MFSIPTANNDQYPYLRIFAFLFTSQKKCKNKGDVNIKDFTVSCSKTHRQRDRHRDCKDHISFSLVEGNEQFNWWHATTTKSHWSFCKIIHTATSTIGLAVEYGATAAARVLSFYRVTRRHRDCHGRKAARILITSVTVALLPNNNLASPPRESPAATYWQSATTGATADH